MRICYNPLSSKLLPRLYDLLATETEKKYLLSTLLTLFPTLLVYLAPESKRGGGIFFVDNGIFKINKRGLHVYYIKSKAKLIK